MEINPKQVIELSDDEIYREAIQDNDVLLLAIESIDSGELFDRVTGFCMPYFKERMLEGNSFDYIALGAFKRFQHLRLCYRELIIEKYKYYHGPEG